MGIPGAFIASLSLFPSPQLIARHDDQLSLNAVHSFLSPLLFYIVCRLYLGLCRPWLIAPVVSVFLPEHGEEGKRASVAHEDMVAQSISKQADKLPPLSTYGDASARSYDSQDACLESSCPPPRCGRGYVSFYNRKHRNGHFRIHELLNQRQNRRKTSKWTWKEASPGDARWICAQSKRRYHRDRR